MRRNLISACALLALLLAAAASASAASAPRARLRHFVCQRAVDPAARAVSATAVMRPLRGTAKLALRFELLYRPRATGSFRSVSGGDLGAWISPGDPTLGRRSGDVWILNKQVVNLAAPAAYRLRVFFRWLGARNRILGTAVRETATCAQPELRPDLRVASIAVMANPAKPSLSDYVATIENAGAAAAGPFEVLYSPGGGAQDPLPRNLAGLAAHTSIQVRFLGPACTSASTPTITVDPNKQVEDANRGNNSKTVVCSAALASASQDTLGGR